MGTVTTPEAMTDEEFVAAVTIESESAPGPLVVNEGSTITWYLDEQQSSPVATMNRHTGATNAFSIRVVGNYPITSITLE